ncbi:unnamed protein product, partial [Closterium sp. NIES-54]
CGCGMKLTEPRWGSYGAKKDMKEKNFSIMFGSKPAGVSVDPAAGLAVVPSSVCKPEAGGGVGVVPGEPLEELLSFLADMSSFVFKYSERKGDLETLTALIPCWAEKPKDLCRA